MVQRKTGGIVANTENPWINIPTDTAMVGDTVFYFTPVINNTEYGNGNLRLPYRVRIWLRPWFIKNLDTMKYICTDHDTLRVKAGGMDVSYRWYKDGDSIAGATDTFFVVTQPGKYHVMVKDTVTPPNIISSDTMNVYFREFPVITKDLKAPVETVTGSATFWKWAPKGIICSTNGTETDCPYPEPIKGVIAL